MMGRRPAALARKATSDTTATETGLAMMPIWLAMDDAGHRPFGPDAVLDGHVVDDGQHGVDHVPGAAQHGQAAGGERRQDGDVLRVAAQQLFGRLAAARPDRPRPAAWPTRRPRPRWSASRPPAVCPAKVRPKAKVSSTDTDAAQQAERHAALARAVEQADQDDGQFDLTI
jgi:hypothetical protein